jgi:hypothetical protein
MSLETGKQRFTNAIRCLVDEPGDIKERLLIAFVSQLSAITSNEDLPAQMVEPFDKISIRLNRDQVVGDRGNPASQLKKISDKEACEIAGDLFAMFLQLHGLASGA